MRARFIFVIVLLATVSAARCEELPPGLFDARIFDVEGKECTLADWKGKVVLLHFFAKWCMTCRDDLKALEELYETFRDRGVVVIGVSSFDSIATLRQYADELKLSFPVLADTDEMLKKEYTVDALPLTIVFNASGRRVSFPDLKTGELKERIEGPQGWNSRAAAEAIEAVLAGSG